MALCLESLDPTYGSLYCWHADILWILDRLTRLVTTSSCAMFGNEELRREQSAFDPYMTGHSEACTDIKVKRHFGAEIVPS